MSDITSSIVGAAIDPSACVRQRHRDEVTEQPLGRDIVGTE
jgi:hypothetical protein